MTERRSTTLGLHPLPDPAKDELRALKGNQMEDLVSGDESAEIGDVYEEVRSELLDRQTTAGLDLVVEGQARWDDMLAHPLAVADAVETRGLVRYYDNNNFYREPVVTGALSPTGDVAGELAAARDRTETGLQGVLPGPYTLAELATDEHYGDEAAFLGAIAEFLAAEAAAFPELEAVFLLEPSLVTAPPADGERVSEALGTVAGAIDADVIVVPYWGALDEQTHAHVLDAAIDGLGYDLVSAPDEATYLVQEYGTTDDVALGVVDGQNTLVESPSTISERIDWFTDRTPVSDYDRIYATPNTGLFYLPTNRFGETLRALGAATAEVPA